MIMAEGGHPVPLQHLGTATQERSYKFQSVGSKSLQFMNLTPQVYLLKL